MRTLPSRLEMAGPAWHSSSCCGHDSAPFWIMFSVYLDQWLSGVTLNQKQAPFSMTASHRNFLCALYPLNFCVVYLVAVQELISTSNFLSICGR
jgi:hypothetical protein